MVVVFPLVPDRGNRDLMLTGELEQRNVARATERNDQLSLERIASRLAARVGVGLEDPQLAADRFDGTNRQIVVAVQSRLHFWRPS